MASATFLILVMTNKLPLAAHVGKDVLDRLLCIAHGTAGRFARNSEKDDVSTGGL